MESHTHQLHFTSCAVAFCAAYVRLNLSYKDPEFASFRKTLDAKMKRLRGTPGVVSAPKQAEPLTDAEEILWSKGLLGNHGPQSLVDTMVFMAGMYLRGGEEHRQLWMSAFKLIEKPGCIPYLQYTIGFQEKFRWSEGYSETSHSSCQY